MEQRLENKYGEMPLKELHPHLPSATIPQCDHVGPGDSHLQVGRVTPRKSIVSPPSAPPLGVGSQVGEWLEKLDPGPGLQRSGGMVPKPLCSHEMALGCAPSPI